MDRTAALIQSPLIILTCVGVPAVVFVGLCVIFGRHRRRQQRLEQEAEERNRQRVAWHLGTTRDKTARTAAANPSIWDTEAQLAPCVRSWPRDQAREQLPAYELDSFTDSRTSSPRANERTWFT